LKYLSGNTIDDAAFGIEPVRSPAQPQHRARESAAYEILHQQQIDHGQITTVVHMQIDIQIVGQNAQATFDPVADLQLRQTRGTPEDPEQSQVQVYWYKIGSLPNIIVRFRTNGKMTKTTEENSRAAIQSWLAVVRAYHLCDAVMTQNLAAIGMRTPDHEILAKLLRDPGISQQVLAQRCFTAKSHISSLVAQLEKRGWVKREPDPADARARRLRLTAKGEAMAKKTAVVQAGVVRAMAEAVSTNELAAIEDTMLRLAAKLETLRDAGA
jgi:DNA-binding MarR family transcriptional regulator